MSSLRHSLTKQLEHYPFIIPLTVVATLVAGGILQFTMHQPSTSNALLLSGIFLGSFTLIRDTFESLRKKSFALDYIALLAIFTGVITQNYLVAGVIVLMMSGGNALESYAQQRAKKSLTALKNRIPNQVQTLSSSGDVVPMAIEKAPIGTKILVRKGEIVPLDGTLQDASGTFDESSLTGEAFPVEKQTGDLVRSGTSNTGQAIVLVTTVRNTDSTYHRIVKLVQEAESAKTPFIQLADTISGWFTILTLILAGLAYASSGGDLNRVLAVLVIATPCPLILATPIALVGGMNAAAQHRIIFKRLAALEILARTKHIIFDKTGTITLGTPQLQELSILKKAITRSEVLALAAGLERNSLHPYAKALIAESQSAKIKPAVFSQIQEKLGVGIEGISQGETYLLAANKNHPDSQVVLTQNKKEIAVFSFQDELKRASIQGIKTLQKLGLNITVFTGDSQERADAFGEKLPSGIPIHAEMSPQEKQAGVKRMKQAGQVVAMVGDGINDAPAIAQADVGLVFSHQEHTATSEAADVVVLGGDFQHMVLALQISRHTMSIAKQSMYLGIGLSLMGMIFAVLGFLPPLAGAVIQEVIDVAVILNALRAATYSGSATTDLLRE